MWHFARPARLVTWTLLHPHHQADGAGHLPSINHPDDDDDDDVPLSTDLPPGAGTCRAGSGPAG